jgi:hypothetical protein
MIFLENNLKQLWKTILDGLTFTDLAGCRQPRQYVLVAGLILFISVTLAGASWFNRLMLKYSMKETYMPRLEATAIPPTEQISAPTDIPCPVLSEQWSLSDPVIEQNYKVIQPACVYDGLAHTVAWALAVRNGYSREQARQLLGFSELPMRQMDHVAIPNSDSNGPQDVAVSFIPPTLNFIEWRVDDQGRPAVSYGMRGCFRTSNVVGNKVEIWGGEYPVICVVVEDAENTHIIYNLGEHYFTNQAIPTRSFLLFGYVGDGYWVWLGTQNNPKMNIEDFAETDNERLTVALLFDSQPWDLAWLQSRYGLTQQPLPDGWQNFNDPAEQQIILDELVKGIMVTP